MKINNQTKVALTTAACLVVQGYVFEYILKVQPNFLVCLAPLILYVIYLVVRGRIAPVYRNPLYWISAVIMLTVADVLAYSL